MNSEADFRAEVRSWMAENAPPGVLRATSNIKHPYWGGQKSGFESEDQKLWFERMRDRGWTAPTWPVEYGGAGLSTKEGRIIDQEMARIGAYKPLGNQGLWMLGPALMEYGSEEQKAYHLPRIARGEVRWAQGYSEPGAGSDLASLKTRGVEDGDDFIVNGAKTWSTYADKSDWMFVLVRTEPDAGKHAGISFLLVDMDTPGITTRPMKLISGDEHFCETFFDDVRVPQSHVVGGRGKGWDITRALLRHERSMMGDMIGSGSHRRPVREIAQESERLASRPALREDVIDCELDAWALQIWMERMGDDAKAGNFEPNTPSALKVFGTELSKKRSETVLSLLGPDALQHGTKESYDWLQWPTGTIGGGTTEINLNVIARRGLGLPQK